MSARPPPSSNTPSGKARDLAFAGAGLASAVSDVVNDDVLTFLRRAERHTLGPVPRAAAARAFREPIEANGRTVSEPALTLMVDGAGGYPFMIQLVGAQTWRIRPEQAAINISDARQGVADARRRLATLIHEPALHAASDIDKAFRYAMIDDDGPSRMADIQQRLGVDINDASQYRLSASGISTRRCTITASAHGAPLVVGPCRRPVVVRGGYGMRRRSCSHRCSSCR